MHPLYTTTPLLSLKGASFSVQLLLKGVSFLFLPLFSARTFKVSTAVQVGYDSTEIAEDLEGFFDQIYKELGIISCNNFTGRLSFVVNRLL